ncbi:MAG TPA: T9SS type A sorting domain-containing protein, partial [Saprospiraceae bacterium]|nr:T9SS type A sorting domain-containing protein [Saprospiraceae bacterium]
VIWDAKYRNVGCEVFGRKITINEYKVGEGCRKWIVQFEYVNWCTNTNAGTRKTIYKYEDKIAPTIVASMNDTIEVGADCSALFKAMPMAIDSGGCETGLTWVIRVYGIGYDQSKLPVGSNPSAEFVNIPAGTYDVLYKVTDGCGNVTEKIAKLVVIGKDPTPYCIDLSSAVMKNGTVELWAKDFDKGSFVNCTNGAIYFTFDNQHPVLSKLDVEHFFKGQGQNATAEEYAMGIAQKWLPEIKVTTLPNGETKREVTGGSSGRLFGCKVGDGSTFPVSDIKMTVWDRNLLSDFCVVRLTLVDNQKACGDGSLVVVAGKIETETNARVPNVEVALDAALPEYPRVELTNANGEFSFKNVPVGANYEVKPGLNLNHKNGVNTLDLVHIQRHILALKKLDSPYKMIAADADNDQAVRVGDLVELRKLILGINEKLAYNQSWRFVEAAQTMGERPWPFNETMTHASLIENKTNDNFIAVKIGDVDASAKMNLTDQNVAPRSVGITLSATERNVNAGDIITIDLTAAQFKDVYGFQLSARLSGLKLINIEGRGIEIARDNYAIHHGDIFTMSWSTAKAHSVLDGSTVMTMQFEASKAGKLSDMVKLNSEITNAEAYVGESMEVSSIQLDIRNFNDGKYALNQNEPNPWRGETVISYELPNAAQAKFTVMDITGKIVTIKTVDGQAGSNKIGFTKAELGGASGVLIYRIESDKFSAQRKMIVIE